MNALSLRVVVVDDNDDYRQLIRWALANGLTDIAIDEMTSGQQLIDWLAEYRRQQRKGFVVDNYQVTVILLDLHMPGLSGLDTLKLLGDMSELPYMPVIMLTSSVSEQLKQQAYQQGIHLYMIKPTRPGGLYRVVEAVKLCYRDTLRLREQMAIPPVLYG
ncbi:response regulator [Spirosoma gilvum]